MMSCSELLLTLEPDNRYRVDPKDWPQFEKLICMGLGEDTSSHFAGSTRGFVMSTAGVLLHGMTLRCHRYEQAVQLSLEDLEKLPKPFRLSLDGGVFNVEDVISRLTVAQQK